MNQGQPGVQSCKQWCLWNALPSTPQPLEARTHRTCYQILVKAAWVVTLGCYRASLVQPSQQQFGTCIPTQLPYRYTPCIPLPSVTSSPHSPPLPLRMDSLRFTRTPAPSSLARCKAYWMAGNSCPTGSPDPFRALLGACFGIFARRRPQLYLSICILLRSLRAGAAGVAGLGEEGAATSVRTDRVLNEGARGSALTLP